MNLYNNPVSILNANSNYILSYLFFESGYFGV